MYDLAKYIHILAAVVWVGGAVYAQALALRVQRSSDPNDLAKLGRNIEYLGTRISLPASIVLFLAGVYMTIARWAFQQTWISIAIILFFGSVLVGAFYLGPRSKRVGELFAAEGAGSTDARRLMDRLFLVSRLELVSFAVIIALMVFKPTLG